MYKAVRARLCALKCRARGARKDAGMVTSEYAMGIVAAVGFAVLLHQVVTSEGVSAQLTALVRQALSAGA
ncbi:DUF4244 domain-containing protein [Streptomyces sp. NPDC048481]|uniref:DUF4244 domain-containing protein n=1 Tax=Streptomyces sp. NPDC048481 TaxID=3365557 RepID=UPI003710AB22